MVELGSLSGAAWAGVIALATGCGAGPRAPSSNAATDAHHAPSANVPDNSPPSTRSSADAPMPPTENAPSPPGLPAYMRVPGRAPEGERTLGKLATLVVDPQLSALSVAEVFGAVTPAKAFRSDLVIGDPLADATRLVLSRRRVQNRQFITSVGVTFRDEVAPTISDVLRRLGAPPPPTAVRLAHHCSHGPCPTYRTTFRVGAVELVATVHVPVDGVVFDGRLIGPFQRAADPRATAVARLRLEPTHGACAQGAPVEEHDRMTLKRAANERERLLVAAVEASALAMALDAVDTDAIERALGVTMPRGEDRFSRLQLPIGLEPHATLLAPHLEVRWWANAMSDHSEVSISLDDDSVPPLALPGLSYVNDPSRLCRVYRDGEHLFEPVGASTGRYRVEVSLRARHPVSGGPPHLTDVSIRRPPRDERR